MRLDWWTAKRYMNKLHKRRLCYIALALDLALQASKQATKQPSQSDIINLILAKTHKIADNDTRTASSSLKLASTQDARLQICPIDPIERLNAQTIKSKAGQNNALIPLFCGLNILLLELCLMLDVWWCLIMILDELREQQVRLSRLQSAQIAAARIPNIADSRLRPLEAPSSKLEAPSSNRSSRLVLIQKYRNTQW